MTADQAVSAVSVATSWFNSQFNLAGESLPDIGSITLKHRVDEDGTLWADQVEVELDVEHFSKPFTPVVCLEMGHVVYEKRG